MKNKISVFSLLLLLSSPFILAGANDLSDLRGLSLTNAKIPIYNRGGRPQMMIFVNKAERHGRVLSGTETVLEFIRPGASVDSIGDAWKTKVYPLGAPFKQVFDFWLTRSKYSDAVVTAKKADIDPETHKASGSSPIFFRSPLLDLNGIGFEADFDRREIRVNSEIEIVLRTGGNDPRKIDRARDKKYEYMTASGDSLLIELENKRILLIGSVVIKEKQAVISCDRLTIEMSNSNDLSFETEKKGKKKKKKQLIDAKSELDGLSRLLADGNIEISGTAGESGKLYADHMVYDLKNSKITLSSDSSARAMSPQKIIANAAKFGSMDPADIEGSVILDDKNTRFYGKSIIVNLKRSNDGSLPTGLVGSSMPGNKKSSNSVQTIQYPEGIVITGKADKNKQEAPFVLHAGQGEFLPGHNVINLQRNVIARDGSTRLMCKKAVLKLKKSGDGNTKTGGLDLNSIHCRDDVRLYHQGTTSQSGTLLADKADFFPADNKILFYDNVNAKHDKSTLKCNQLELLLSSRTAPQNARGKAQTALLDSAVSSKSLKQVIATGNVHMTDPHATLNTGILTMYFRDLVPGEKPVPGMFQAGGARLVRIDCGSGVKVVSRSNAETKKLFGSAESKGVKTLTAMRSTSDLLSDKTTLDGNVNIYDDLSMLKCDTLHLYGKKIRKMPAAAPKKKAADDIDADPYAMLNTENFAPSRIALTGDLELDKVECVKNVVLSRKVQNDKLRAGGDHAEYKVSTQKIVITGKAPKRPWVEMDGRRQESDRLIYHLAEERFESSGNTQTTMKVSPDKIKGGKK